MLTAQAVERTVCWALRRNAGASIEEQARKVREALEVLIEAGAGEEEQEQPLPIAPSARRLPASPAVQPRQPESLIVTPDSAEGLAALAPRKAAVVPIAVDTLTATPGDRPGPRRAWWKMDALAGQVEGGSPATLDITIEHPDRGEVVLTLERNINCMPGVNSADAVKLSYKSPSFGDDMAAAVTFWTTDREIDIQAAIDKIIASAKSLYRPRPRVIENRATSTGGALTFDPTNAHADTDKLYRNGTAF